MAEDFDQNDLCHSCGTEPVYIEGLCEFCYSDFIDGRFKSEELKKETMVKHSQGLKQNQELNQERSIKKLGKLKK